MEAVKLLVLAGVFFALTPGILVKVPSGGSVLKVAAAHAILFGLVYLVATYLFESLEEFAVPKLKLASSVLPNGPELANASKFSATAITAGAAVYNVPLLYLHPQYPGLGSGTIIPVAKRKNLPTCQAGYVVDVRNASGPTGPFTCIPVPSQYILPPVSNRAYNLVPRGGGWYNKQNRTVSKMSALPLKEGGTIPVWCPPGYVNDLDPSLVNISTGNCIEVPTGNLGVLF